LLNRLSMPSSQSSWLEFKTLNLCGRTLLSVPFTRSAPPRAAPLVELRTLKRGSVIANRYRVDESLADGGMGTIWSATDRATGRRVVVKTMHVQLAANGEAVQRFEQEAAIIAAVRSPHVVELLDHGVISGTPYLVLERLDGEDLEQRLARRRLDVDECGRILDQVARGLLPAHVRGVVHRDLKPANIFMSRIGESEIVKLLDFGIAKLSEGARFHTAAGETVGSPEFMSPEQVQGERNLDGRSDVFAMASVVYTCLTGRMPFTGPTIVDTLGRIVAGRFTPPSEVSRDVPPALDAFFERAFAVDRDVRYPNAAVMAQAFRELSDPERMPARRPDDPELRPLPRHIPPGSLTTSASGKGSALRLFGPALVAFFQRHRVAPVARAQRLRSEAPPAKWKWRATAAAAVLAIAGGAAELLAHGHSETTAPATLETTHLETHLLPR